MMVIRDFAERCRQGMAELGLSLASHREIIEGRALALRTVGPHIATADTLSDVQDYTAASSFVFKGSAGDMAGVLAVIPLNPLAAGGLAAGVFDGVRPPKSQIARPGDPVIAIYGWGMAGATWRGRGVVMGAAIALHRDLFPELPLYGRAATPGGERTLLKRMGAEPLSGPGGLVLAPPWNLERAAA